ncbi:MAG TPA: di-heme oxidoredictase family protein, partial [Planctomycetota bacterium]|nr:di-heme oxidoredictase family protein [Planctomycetota bacterium]
MRMGIALALLLAACGGSGGSAVAQLGDPNPGLGAEMLAAFERGRDVFVHRFTRAEGHGPDFNVDSCKSCHEIPVVGGSSPLYRNFFLVGHVQVGGAFTPAMEGNQFVARTFSYVRAQRETIPDDTVVAQRNAPPLFGLGAFERLTGAEISANADPTDADGDGISGRTNIDGTLVGRFGYKAQEGSLIDFVRGPFFNHMGITSNFPPLPPPGTIAAAPQVAPPAQPLVDGDGVLDPEIPDADLIDLVIFLRELAPPAPLPMDATARRGEEVFTAIGCAKCHIPNVKQTGQPAFAYTDLLIHEMGPELADQVAQLLATGSEFRTQPLWGVRFTAPFLHDGRAPTLDEAIRLHGGEALAIKDDYVALPQADKDAIVAFL